MKNKIFLISFILFASLTIISVRAKEIGIKINDEEVKLDSEIIIMEGRSMLPFKEFCDILGIADARYDEKYDLIIIKDEEADTLMFMSIGIYIYQHNDQILQLDVAPVLKDDVIYIPISFVARTFDFKVSWDEKTSMVVLNKDGFEVPKEYKLAKEEAKPAKEEDKPAKTYTDDDLMWLSRIVTVEASNLSYEGKLAIANVVLNRVKSPAFPATVHDVIFQIDGRYVQFPPAHRKSFTTRKINADAAKAALAALEGTNNIETCLYFNNAPFRSRKKDLFKIIDGEYFYK